MKGYMDRFQLADFFSVSWRTIARWDYRHIGPPRVKIGRKWWYPIKQANEWRDSQTEIQSHSLGEHKTESVK